MQASRELLKTLYTMAMLVEARDAYTGGHLWRVSRYSHLLAEDLHLPQPEVERIALGGFLHDLGKIGVPDAVLNKPDRLSDEEYEVIKTHPRVGADLLRDHPLAELVMDAVLCHHETPDGNGYPQRLAGKAIPLVARIVGITDAFDAMTSTRPYRQGMPLPKALAILEENLGRQFDQELGSRFIQLGRSGRLDGVLGHSEPGIPMQSCLACGPIIAVPGSAADGDEIFCPSCAGGYRLRRGNGQLSLAPSGNRDPVKARQPRADSGLIDSLLQGSGPLRARSKPGLLDLLFG
ncbi:HD domain-containing protein [Chromobacterium subtsugae]|uniref:HD domain-containing protein n=1 Tax=Chromobacterium subtsugae TaxID=251747 RepID=A0ABS7FHG5_9NEIS|nr:MULTISPECIES: HD domain-containing phosphohydrolase [Chromobacterium]KUM02290.1 phosphohydrolase [Chromobacterium subtsugae]KZE86245.1 phosphohydrolase [Chromobacterium sp. F49]MBW7568091.1 HD domain-containing protein [Chromobacterium subtsugae]MBW8289535.1 HD domain-containing protein [Chromobacterium subtsugae]OBU86230.1 phosphohydrolase [Chromobacterium subtsugae]